MESEAQYIITNLFNFRFGKHKLAFFGRGGNCVQKISLDPLKIASFQGDLMQGY